MHNTTSIQTQTSILVILHENLNLALIAVSCCKSSDSSEAKFNLLELLREKPGQWQHTHKINKNIHVRVTKSTEERTEPRVASS